MTGQNKIFTVNSTVTMGASETDKVSYYTHDGESFEARVNDVCDEKKPLTTMVGTPGCFLALDKDR